METAQINALLDLYTAKLSSTKPYWIMEVGKRGYDVNVIELMREVVDLREEVYELQRANSELDDRLADYEFAENDQITYTLDGEEE